MMIASTTLYAAMVVCDRGRANLSAPLITWCLVIEDECDGLKYLWDSREFDTGGKYVLISGRPVFAVLDVGKEGACELV